MKYYLIVQWKNRVPDLERLNSLERMIGAEADLRGVAVEMSGNDVGSNECNLFIRTNDPQGAFAAAHSVITSHGEMLGLRAAFRVRGEEEHVILWPKGSTEFDVS